MFRYVSMIWNERNQQEADAVELVSRRLKTLSMQWREVWNCDGLRIFCADMRPGSLEAHTLENHAGVVLGSLFERNTDIEDPSPCCVPALGVAESDAIVATGGRSLVTRYWGNYVAFVADPIIHTKWVIKDPTGSLPCFSSQFRDVLLYFSCIEDCVSLGLLRFAVNRSYLHSRMTDFGCYRQNPLQEIFQVNRGECTEIVQHNESTQVSTHLYWTPVNFSYSHEPIDDPNLAARAIRATVRACTHSLARHHQNALLRLSGGLDSSIISGCLQDAAAMLRITCYTNYNPRGRSDERPWARMAAQHAGWEHVENAVTPEDIPLATCLQMPVAVEPMLVLDFLQRTTFEQRLAVDSAATAVFTGDGGDSGFCSDSIGFAVSEFLVRYGLHPSALKIASHVALLLGLSTWQVIARSLRQWWLGSKSSHGSSSRLNACRLVNPELLRNVPSFEYHDHPWFRDIGRIPGGMPSRLGMLLATPDFYSGYAGAKESRPQMLAPLYSQPAIELFLRIPLHVHFEDGYDRGLARRAFAQEVPDPILRRHWKDRAPGFHDELIYRNLGFLRDLFLDGILVSERLLDRRAVEHALTSTPARNAVYAGEILHHLGTEIWARHWLRSRASQQRAVA